MNRVIKFRGKVIDNGGLFRNRKNGEWIYSSESFVHTDEGIFIGKYNEEIKVDPNTVGQYTGITDESGLEIYEGDIVSIDCGGVNAILPVLYQDGCFVLIDDDSAYDLINEPRENITVIGNIYDNPELLENE